MMPPESPRQDTEPTVAPSAPLEGAGGAAPGLKRQVASGMFWVALGQIFGRGLGYITTLILAKLVTPQQFGLVGMAGLALAALALFQDVGFEAALVYKRGAKRDVDAASHTAFYTVILTSLVICAIAMLGAPLVADFFREPAVVPILRVLSLTVVISSFGRVPYVLLSRDLNFRRRLFPDITASIVASIIAIVMAFRGFGVWSLVWRELIKTTLATVLVFFVCPYRPRWQFSRPAARELFSYGKHIMSSQGLIFLITNVDNAVVGRYLGDSALGFYQFAYNTSNQPATQLTSIISQVMFPALSKMGDSDPEAARALRVRYYFTTIRYVIWIATPIAVAMILFAPAFIYGLYGDVWAAAIVPLQVLALYGFIRSIAANMGSIFRAMGKPQWLTYIATWRLITMVVLLIPVALKWNINGVSWLSTIVAVVDFVISGWLVNKLIHAPWHAYARLLAPAWAAALVAGFAALGLYPYLPFAKASWNLLLAGTILVLGYFVLSLLIDGQFRTTVRSLVRQGRRLIAARGTGSVAAAGR